MLVTSTNDVKQYNLTQGRSLPEWLDERKRRKLLSVKFLLWQKFEMLCFCDLNHLEFRFAFLWQEEEMAISNTSFFPSK